MERSPQNQTFLNREEWMQLTARLQPGSKRLTNPDSVHSAIARETSPREGPISMRASADTQSRPTRPGPTSPTTGMLPHHSRSDILFRLTAELLQWVCESPQDQDADRKWFATQALESLYLLDKNTASR
eukprot:Gregarina_sp_Poly_1__4609@NODE_246_length_10752_cov_151_576135_g216_i0_p14_GENE_NODE_246_length_10752_cov_151_576135_g216_i0NODE_246_length_10752_cov_151_576135_g216_i0_p14_ORF_typecomplete_len129_score10_09_NODE_246_length_10752_cov_151_576135_g216_i022942680